MIAIIKIVLKMYTTKKLFNTLRLKSNASVLVVVMIVVALLAAMSAGLAYRGRMEMQTSKNYIDSLKAYHLAIGGIDRIRAVFSAEEISPARIKQISMFEKDAQEEGLFETVDRLKYRIRDEMALLSVNESDPAVWINFDEIDEATAKCILDWIDEDSMTDSSGAENEYYIASQSGYQCKDKNIEAIRELMYVRGIDAKIYYGDDEKHGLINLFSAYGDGRVNINTVSADVIDKLPGLGTGIGSAIEQFRNSDSQNCFKSSQDFSQITELSEMDTDLLGQYCRFDSEYFRIYSQGTADKSRCNLMAVVKLNGTDLEVLSIERIQ